MALARRAAATLDRDGGGGDVKPTLVVSAAASLKNAFTDYAKAFAAATSRCPFAGSDELAAQIRQGVKPDVFASANTKLPDELYAEGLVEKPVVVRLQPARARGAGRQLGDRRRSTTSTKPGVDDRDRLGVRAGRRLHAQGARRGCPADKKDAILANVRSNEPDVGGVVGKVTQGAVDAGFVYVTDVEATERQAEGDRAPGGAAAARSPTASPWSRAPSTRSRRQQFVDGLLDGDGPRARSRAPASGRRLAT